MSMPNQVQFDREDQDFSQACNAPELRVAASAKVVNRTHRVVRQRAKLMRDRRSHTRSLLVPLLLCSALLLITVLAVWSGVYQEGAGAVKDASASLLSTTDNDEFVVLLFWFVPVTLAALGAVWFTRFRNSAESETVR